MSKQLLSICIPCLLLLWSCKKDERQLKEETHPIEYVFINNGDDNILAVVLYTNIAVKVFDGIRQYDTVRLSGHLPNYFKVNRYALDIRFKKHVFSQVAADRNVYGQGSNTMLGMVRARIYNGDSTYLQSQAASGDKVFFRWPSDTLVFKESYILD